ncbi:MAG: glycosyltransferase [Bacteroidota bacterium]
MKKVLIITYYWPPSGGSGVQRCLYFVKYLRDFGYEPVVYTVANGEYPAIDETLAKEIPDGVEVIKSEIWEPYQLYKKFTGQKKEQRLKPLVVTEKKEKQFAHKISTWIRGNFFIPDARKFWIKPSIEKLTDYLQQNPVDLILSSSPPQSVHLIALALKKKFQLPWVADFRDPWTKISYYDDLMLTPWADNKHKRLEKEVLTAADVATTVSWSCQQGFESIVPRKIEVITNGFDDTIQMPKLAPDSNLFTISYTGTLSRDRNPIKIWEGLQELIIERPELAGKLKIRFIGDIDDSVFDSFEQLGICQIAERVGYVKHHQVFEYLASSDLLLLIGIPNDKGVLTGKLFEYLFSKKPILSIGPNGGDIETILAETKAGVNVDFDEKDPFKKALKNFIDRPKGAQPTNLTVLNKFTRKNLTGQLAGYFDRLLGVVS